MRLHMDRVNAWCRAGESALPPAMREHCTPELPVQGNTIEKSRGNLVRSNIGSADEAWTEIADKISGACARLRDLVGAGLAHPTAQSVFRVWSALPEHVLRTRWIALDFDTLLWDLSLGWLESKI